MGAWRLSVPGGVVTVRFNTQAGGAEEVELSELAVLVHHGDLIYN